MTPDVLCDNITGNKMITERMNWNAFKFYLNKLIMTIQSLIFLRHILANSRKY